MGFGRDQYQERASVAPVPSRRYQIVIREASATNLEIRLRSNEDTGGNDGGAVEVPIGPIEILRCMN